MNTCGGEKISACCESHVLAWQQQYATAIMRYRANKPEADYSQILVAVAAGWLYFDGAEIRESGFVAVTPDATREILTTGREIREEDVIQRLP